MLGFSLRQLCKSFKVETLKSFFPFLLTDLNYKGEFPSIELYSKIDKSDYDQVKSDWEKTKQDEWSFKEQSIKYCYIDCIALFEILVKFNELIFNQFKINIHSSLTLPSLAMNIFKSLFMPENTLYQLLGKPERDIREAYTGGAVDVYQTNNSINWNPFSLIKRTLYYYDVNSLYPYIMANLAVPVGKPIAFEGDIRKVDPRAQGFFYCEMKTPDNDFYPILQRKVKTLQGIRTIAGLGTWTGWISSYELDNAAKRGYEFKIIRGYKFRTQVIFDKYVNTMYNLRLKYSKDDPMNFVAKLLLNSLYGKFGMKTETTQVTMYDTKDIHDRKVLKFTIKDLRESIQDIFYIDNFVVILEKDVIRFKYNEKEDLYHGLDVNIAIAATITAGGRIHMSQFKPSGWLNKFLFYTDTDSLICSEKLPSRLVGNQLGQMKLEHIIKDGVFLAPKVYGFITSFAFFIYIINKKKKIIKK